MIKINTHGEDILTIWKELLLIEILKDYELYPDDIDKIWKIINKKNSH